MRISRQILPIIAVIREKELLTKLVNVGVEDLGSEEDFGRHHWVLFRQEELAVEHTALVCSTRRPSQFDVEVSEVLLARLGIDAHN